MKAARHIGFDNVFTRADVPCLNFKNPAQRIHVKGSNFEYMTLLDKHKNDIKRLCTAYKVRRLYAFGSVLTSQFDEKSDIDFIADFEPQSTDHYADNYFNLKFALEDIFKRPVDLLEEKAIKNPYFKQAIEKKRQLIYGY